MILYRRFALQRRVVSHTFPVAACCTSGCVAIVSTVSGLMPSYLQHVSYDYSLFVETPTIHHIPTTGMCTYTAVCFGLFSYVFQRTHHTRLEEAKVGVVSFTCFTSLRWVFFCPLQQTFCTLKCVPDICVCLLLSAGVFSLFL